MAIHNGHEGTPPEIIFNNTVSELHRLTHFNVHCIQLALLGMMSVPLHHKVRVQIPGSNKVEPCTIFAVVLAESGTGKSMVFDLIQQPYNKAMNELRSDARNKTVEYETAMEVWKCQEKHLLSEIKKAVRMNESDLIDKYQDELLALRQKQPVDISMPELIKTDITSEALFEEMSKTDLPISVLSSEGGGFFNHLNDTGMANLNELFNASNVEISRVSKGNFKMLDKSTSIMQMTQPERFMKFIESKKGLTIDSGFMPRFQIAEYVESNMSLPDMDRTAWGVSDYCFIFREWMKCLSIRTKRTIEFDAKASYHFLAFKNIDVQNLIHEHPDLKKFLVRLPSQVARVSAIIHAFGSQKNENRISEATFNLAKTICLQSWPSWKRYFGEETHEAKVIKSANRVLKYLRDNVFVYGNYQPYGFSQPADSKEPKNTVKKIRQNGPIDEIGLLKQALSYLHHHKIVNYVDIPIKPYVLPDFNFYNGMTL